MSSTLSRARTASLRVHAGGWAAAATFVVSASACSKDAPQMQTPQVTVAAAIERTVADWDEFTGHFEAINSVEVRPRVGGFIQRVAFTEGATVHQGDALFVIDPRPYQAEVARAEAVLANNPGQIVDPKNIQVGETVQFQVVGYNTVTFARTVLGSSLWTTTDTTGARRAGAFAPGPPSREAQPPRKQPVRPRGFEIGGPNRPRAE